MQSAPHRCDTSTRFVADDASDDDLICAFRAGDPTALDRLVRRHRPWIFRLLKAVVQDDEHAQDLTQEVFCRLYRNAGYYTARDKFVPWIKCLTMNIARNFLRERRYQQQRVFAWQETPQGDREIPCADPQRNPQSVLASRLLQEEVGMALLALSAEQRQVISLHYFGGKSVDEIAQALCCPVGTIKSRLFHARRRLRTVLRVEEQEKG